MRLRRKMSEAEKKAYEKGVAKAKFERQAERVAKAQKRGYEREKHGRGIVGALKTVGHYAGKTVDAAAKFSEGLERESRKMEKEWQPKKQKRRKKRDENAWF